MENILQGLNASQLEAVTSTEGFIRVIAGAGSGKTRALARRFAYLVNEIGILPGNILCVTFTNKSANEMRQRIHNLTGDNDTGYISTFHSFCVSVLQEDSHALQYPKSFLVLDNSDIDSMLKIIYEERGLTLRNMTFSKARDMIEIRKLIKEPEYYLDMLNMSLDTLRQKYLTATEPSDIIFYGYLLDFDKIFPSVKTIMMMQNYRSTPQIVSVVNDLIDKNKFRIKKNLMPTIADGRKVICHHADTSEREAMWIAEQIQALHGEGTSYREITVLYRAHYITRIVEEVFLREKIPYAIYSGVQFFNRMEIKDALAYLRLIAYKDDLAFLRVVNVPKRNLGERRIKFLQEYAVKHQCSLYIALETNLDNEIFKGTKAAQFVALIENFAANYAERQISELLAAILNESGYEKMLRTEGSQERLDNLAELKQSVYEYETSCGEESTLEHYLSHVALFTNNDAADNSDKVKLMTVHSAKGLEFPYVFLCAMNEGVFPSKKTDTIQKMEEERRLAFVAMTRAQKGLYLSEAEGRNFDGSPRYPSRFLLDIEPALLDYTQKPQEGLIIETKDYLVINERYLADEENQLSLAVGQRVKHNIFGSGTVVDVDLIKAAHLVKFDNIDTPRSISFRAKLEKD